MSFIFQSFPGNHHHKHHSKSLFSEISSLSNNHNIRSLLNSFGLNISQVAWEDTARNKNSCWGPNISDMTLNTNNTNMPIIRKPNFADVTTDIDIDKFHLVVGNHNGSELTKVSLKEYLKHISKYTDNKHIKHMHLDRDNKILTSGQACILPLENGEVEFNVRLYNYQSYKDNPAILVIVASSQGTSCQIVDSSDTKLYFNNNGQASNFLAKRLKDDRKERGVSLDGPMTQEEKERNALYIFQIPLKQKEIKRSVMYGAPAAGCAATSFNFMNEGSAGGCFDDDDNEGCAVPSTRRGMMLGSSIKEKKRGFDDAVLRAGESHGPYYGTKNMVLERDERYPIRCTVQFYKVTDSTEIPQEELIRLNEQINKIYNSGDVISSLIYGETHRPTEPTLENKKAPNKFLSGWSFF